MPEQRVTVQFGANFALDACGVHACQACLGRHWVHDLEQQPACVAQTPGCLEFAAIGACEQDGWGALEDERDADALGEDPELAAWLHAALGTWPKLGLA